MTTKGCRSCGYRLNTDYEGPCPACRDKHPLWWGTKEWLGLAAVLMLLLLFGAASSHAEMLTASSVASLLSH